MRIRAVKLHVVGLLIAALAGVAMGQATRIETGRRLDANPRVGGGGRNPTVRGFRRLDSQLYVTGQVSGLNAFRGSLAYRAPDELRLDLPSAALGDFRRESVGLSDAQAGGTFQPSPYFDPTQTAWRAAGILAGRSAFGRGLGGAPTVHRDLFEEPVAGAPIAGGLQRGQPLGRGLAPAPGIPSIENVPGGPTGGEFWQALRGRPGLRADRFGLFGPAAGQRDRLAGEFAEAARRDERIEALLDDRVDATAGAPLPRGYEPPAEPVEQQAGAAEELLQPGAPVVPTEAERQDESAGTQGARRRILEAEQQRKSRRAGPEVDVLDETLPSVGGEDRSGPTARREQERAVLEPTYERQEAARWGQAGRPGVLSRSIANNASARFQAAMRRGEERLGAGEYYASVGAYELATSLDPKSGLARLGLAVASVAAGEPHSAGLNLKRAFQMDPHLMTVRLDGPGMMGQATFQARLKDIHRRLGGQRDFPDPSLMLVAAFLHHSAGQNEQARSLAEGLLARAGVDEISRSFAEAVLSAPVAIPQPATNPSGL